MERYRGTRAHRRHVVTTGFIDAWRAGNRIRHNRSRKLRIKEVKHALEEQRYCYHGLFLPYFIPQGTLGLCIRALQAVRHNLAAPRQLHMVRCTHMRSYAPIGGHRLKPRRRHFPIRSPARMGRRRISAKTTARGPSRAIHLVLPPAAYRSRQIVRALPTTPR